MTFEQAMHDSCREFGLPKAVKNSYMYLDRVVFCFFQNGDDVDFAISGVIGGNDKLNITEAIEKALKLCRVCEGKMKGGAE